MFSLALIERKLAVAERHVEAPACILALQHVIVDVLENAGGDARLARILLTVELSRALHVEDRDRLQIENGGRDLGTAQAVVAPSTGQA